MRVVVLFASVHGAGRAPMAAAWFNELADPTKARATAAGVRPSPSIQQEVLIAMLEVGKDLAASRPERLTSELAHRADWIVTMGCRETCPMVPGVERDDWPVKDPVSESLERVREIRDDLRRRVSEFVEQHGWQR